MPPAHKNDSESYRTTLSAVLSALYLFFWKKKKGTVGTFFAADGSEKSTSDSAPSVRVLGGVVPTPSYRPAIVYNPPFKSESVTI